MAAIQPGVWGIDLGQCALKALRLENLDGQVTATAFDYVEHPKILSQPDADPDQLIREALEKFLSRNTLGNDFVAISVPGQSGLARFVKLPPVEEKKIVDIVRFEAKQQIPFNLDEVVWDYQKIGSGVVTDGFAMETEIGLFAMKRDMISRYLQHFKEVHVEVNVVQMAPLALCNYVSYDLIEQAAAGEGQEEGSQNEDTVGKKRCVVALDIGADSSNLVITDGDRIIWQRPIPLGGNHFTRALTKDLKLTFAKAEHVKRNATKSPDLKKILSALKPVLNDFVGEVQRSLGYFTNTHRNAYVAYLVGLGNAFRLPGLQRFLGEKLGLEVRKLQQMERLGGDSVVAAPVFTENIASFGVAYGLALQGLKVTRLQTNLLPAEIRVERLIRAKKPWAVAAAAALLLGVTFVMNGEAFRYRAQASSSVQAARKNADDTVKFAKGEEDKFTSKENEVRKLDSDIKAMISGQEERINWVHLNKFIADSLPRADEKTSNLLLLADQDPKVNKDQVRKWNANSVSAYQRLPKLQGELQTSIRKGISSKGDLDRLKSLKKQVDEAKAELIHFNIEAVQASYCKDLSGFLEHKAVKDDIESMRPRSDQKNKPEGAGWVVEIRGFTDHPSPKHPRLRSGPNYVIEALIENLARKGKPEAYQATPANQANGESGAPAKPPETKSDDPITNRISHVVLHNFATDASLINSGSALFSVTSGAAPAAAGDDASRGAGSGEATPGGVGVPGLSGGGRRARVPLIAMGGGSGAYGPGSGEGFGGGLPGKGLISGGGVSTGDDRRQTGSPDSGTPGAPIPGGTAPVLDSPIARTEFIIWFIWKEPIKEGEAGEGGAPAPSGGGT